MELGLEGFRVEAAVDTGFAGEVLVPFSLFRSLGLLSSLSEDEFHLVLPDGRRIGLYSARGRVKLGEDDIVSYIHSSPQVEKKVIGRSFLSSFVAVLDGGEEELTVRKALAH